MNDLQLTVPDCRKPKQPHVESEAYCSGDVPNELQTRHISEALARIEQKGGVCAELARAGRILLQQGTIHIFPKADQRFKDFGGAAPRGGAWMVLQDDMVNDPERVPSFTWWSLDWLLAHELDHHLIKEPPGVTDEYGHLKVNDIVDKRQTPNSVSCSRNA